VIEYRNDGVFLISDAAIDVDHRAHIQEGTTDAGVVQAFRPACRGGPKGPHYIL
jgi:hypothetical protein